MKFKVGDIIINVHTDEVAVVKKVEREWALPVYEVEQTDDDGKVETIRFNVKYEIHWNLVVGEEE